MSNNIPKKYKNSPITFNTIENEWFVDVDYRELPVWLNIVVPDWTLPGERACPFPLKGKEQNAAEAKKTAQKLAEVYYQKYVKDMSKAAKKAVTEFHKDQKDLERHVADIQKYMERFKGRFEGPGGVPYRPSLQEFFDYLVHHIYSRVKQSFPWMGTAEHQIPKSIGYSKLTEDGLAVYKGLFRAQTKTLAEAMVTDILRLAKKYKLDTSVVFAHENALNAQRYGKSA
jgi:hypothetical protein